MKVTDLVPSVSIAALLLRRDAVVERVTRAHELLREGDQLAKALFGETWSSHGLSLQDYRTRREFTSPQGLEDMIKEVDATAWDHLLRESGLRTFMDAAARKKWDEGISKHDVPPLTEASIEATFHALYDARREMFERGVIAVFRGLSWDYKTNCPVMFGRRLVLRRVVDVWGYGQNQYLGGPSHDGSNRLDDLIRVMTVLDGKPEPDHREGSYFKLRAVEWPTKVKDAELHGMVSVRGFKNGNAHMTFLRADLVDKMNAIIARHFPNALAPSREEVAGAA